MNASVLILLAFIPLLHFVLVRLFFLVKGRLGWLNYLSNVVSEIVVKRLQWSRNLFEAAEFVGGISLLILAGIEWGHCALLALVLLGLEYSIRLRERKLLTYSYTPLDKIGLTSGKTAPGSLKGTRFPTPSTHPELTFNLIGPFTARTPGYSLGFLALNRSFEITVVIGNHTIVPTQTEILVTLALPDGLRCSSHSGAVRLDHLAPGDIHKLTFGIEVVKPAPAGKLRVELTWGHFEKTLLISHVACEDAKTDGIRDAKITRYPHACVSAFAWRGDMDLYDDSTLQSIEGLTVAFDLAKRYRFPQTMYLSSRLSLDLKAALEWQGHYHIDRGARRIPEFIDWFNKHVQLCHSSSYPYESAKPYLIELGNHGHLHFGTDTAGAPENGWKARSKIGAGVYPWLSSERSSFAEQRDNALETRRLFEAHFGFTPKSWAMPNRTNDEFTAFAMEAAGCEVLSDSNVRSRHNVLLQPPPHHPAGTMAVELTKRYPGDPQHIFHLYMNLFWVHCAHRRAIPVIFMCHQHIRQFDGTACLRLTEYTLRYVLHNFNGDLHIDTVYGIGKYWKEVLSPLTGKVKVRIAKNLVEVISDSDVDLFGVPVDITFQSGRKATYLIDLPRKSAVSVAVAGGNQGANH
jgi:hypothetical protein